MATQVFSWGLVLKRNSAGMWAGIVGLFVVISLTSGCQSRQEYRSFCSPSTPRLQCSADDQNYKCSQASGLVKLCETYVRRQVARNSPGSELLNLPLQYQNPGYQPWSLVSTGRDGHTYVAYIDGRTTQGFINSVWTLKAMVEKRVDDYQQASASYLNIVSEGMETSDEKVRKSISDLEALGPALQEAQTVGDSILKVIDVPPPFDFRTQALRVVIETAPTDIYLRLAAESAIRSQSQMREQTPQLVRTSKARLSDLQKIVAEPYAQQFADQLQRAEAVGKQAVRERAREWRRAESEGNGYRSGMGGGCSCAGGNVCYGPRGGRYCITSGGKQRYGI